MNKKNKSVRLLAIVMAFVCIMTGIPFSGELENMVKAEEKAGADTTQSSTACPVIGSKENAAEGAIVLRGNEMVSEAYAKGDSISIANGQRVTMEGLSFGDTDTYYYSAKVSGISYDGQYNSIRMVLGYGTFKDNTDTNGTKRYIEVCMRKKNDTLGMDQILFLTTEGGGYLTRGWEKAVAVEDVNNYTYTAKYDNGKISLWVDDKLIFDNVDITNYISPDSVVLEPGFSAFGAAGTISDIQIWGDAGESGVSDTMLMKNVSSGNLLSFDPQKGTSISKGSRVTFENLNFGSYNTYGYSAKVSVSEYLNADGAGNGYLGMVLGYGTYNGTKCYIELCVRQKKDQILFLRDEGGGQKAVLGEKSSDSDKAKIESSSEYTYTAKYNNGKITFWINDYLVFDSKDIAANFTSLVMQPGFYAHNATAAISDVEIWGDVTSGKECVNETMWSGRGSSDATNYTYEYRKNGAVEISNEDAGGTAMIPSNLTIGNLFHMSMTLKYSDINTTNGSQTLDGFFLGTATRYVNEKVSGEAPIYVCYLGNGQVLLWDAGHNQVIKDVGNFSPTINLADAEGVAFTYQMSYMKATDTSTDALTIQGTAGSSSFVKTFTDFTSVLTSGMKVGTSQYTYSDFQFNPGIGRDKREAVSTLTVSDIRIFGDITVEIPQYITVAQPLTNISGDIAVTREINSLEELNGMMQGDNLPSSAIYTINSDLEVVGDDGTAFSTLLDVLNMTGWQVLPIVRISDADTVDALAGRLKSINFYDLCVVSTNAALVKAARTALPLIRGAVDLTDTYQGKKELTLDDCTTIRKTVNANKAFTAFLPAALCDQDIVQELYEFGVDIWAVAEDSLSERACYDVLLSGAAGVVSDDTNTLLTTACEKLPDNTMTRMPLHTGHRGLGSNTVAALPENTIEAGMQAYEMGMGAVEIDVYLTSDDQVVVIHNATTGAVTTDGTDLNVANSTLAQLQALNLKATASDTSGKTYKIPSLDEYLAAFQGKDFKIVIEFKGNDNATVAAVKTLVEKYDMYDQCMALSGHTNILAKLQEEWPEMSVTRLIQTTVCESNSFFDNANPDADVALNVMEQIGVYNTQPTMVRNGNRGEAAIRSATLRGINVYAYGYFENDSSLGQQFMQGYRGLTLDYQEPMNGKVQSVRLNAEGTAAVNSTVVPELKYYTTTQNDSDTISVQVLEGADSVKINEDGSVTFTKAGTVTLFASCKGNFDGKEYTVYSQPVTYNVASVDARMLEVKVQFKEDTEHTDKAVTRFIASIDDLNKYTEGGFILSTKNSNPQYGDTSCKNITGIKTAYTGLYETVNGESSLVNTSKLYGEVSNYMFAYDIGNWQKGMKVYVRAYLKLTDGTMIFGAVREITIE